MKVVSKPIEVISITDIKGNITPLRLRIENEDEFIHVIKIDKIIDRTHEKLAGNNKLVRMYGEDIKYKVNLFENRFWR